MSVDLHRIGTGISSGSSRNGFGKIVSFPSVSGFPAAGSYNSTLTDVTYPIVNGGASVTVDAVAYPSQFCDVTVKNDGSGGTYTDWGTATDIQYFDGETIVTITSTQSPVEMPAPYEGTYYDSEVQNLIFYHDGTGGASDNAASFGYYADGTIIVGSPSTNLQAEVPSESTNFFDNGKYDTYAWDGNGAIELGTFGSFYANNTTIYTAYNQTEVPSGSGNNYNNGQTTIYKWNGSGGFTGTGGGAYYPYGTYITDDGTTAYYWSNDGSGGYYSEAL